MHIGLDYILKNEHFRICRLLTTDQFVDYCKKRDVIIEKTGLERLEELKIFFPIARTTHWPYTAKIRTVDERGGYEDLGPLKESEAWNGETITRYGQFFFGHPDTDAWLQHDHIWDPRTKPFTAWDTFRNDKGIQQMESYYSPFQAHEVWHRTNCLRCQIAAEVWVKAPDKIAGQVTDWANEMLAFAKKQFFRYEIATLCQILSNRYYPLTQTNQRYFNLSAPHDWNWASYCDHWDALTMLDELSLQATDIREAWKMLLIDAKFCDPLEEWYDLVSFTAIEKRAKLKGHALRAQTWYVMEHMLRLFHYDLTNEQLPTPVGPITRKFVP